MTKNEFKTRFLQHRSALKNRASTQSTALSEYVWKIRDIEGVEPKIVWKIKTRAHSYSNGGRQCDLCLSEKREILYAKKVLPSTKGTNYSTCANIKCLSD